MRVIFSAPYRNGMLLTVPTVIVMPVEYMGVMYEPLAIARGTSC